MTPFCRALTYVIPIEPYFGRVDDQELPKLLDFLQRLPPEETAVAEIKKIFGLEGYLQRDESRRRVRLSKKEGRSSCFKGFSITLLGFEGRNPKLVGLRADS